MYITIPTDGTNCIPLRSGTLPCLGYPWVPQEQRLASSMTPPVLARHATTTYRTMLAEPNYSSKKFKSSNSNFSVQHSCILATCDLLPPPPLDIHHLKHAHWLRLVNISNKASCGLGASNLAQRRHIERQHILILQCT